jgi:hypothetical protein
MEIIIGGFILLFLLVAIVVIVSSRLKEKKNTDQKPEETKKVASDCCGAHEVCDVDELFQNQTKIVYFDDEELDKFTEIKESSFTDDQVEEFRDVLYTLKSSEINAWLSSLEIRKINLPAILKQEARQLISDAISSRIAS